MGNKCYFSSWPGPPVGCCRVTVPQPPFSSPCALLQPLRRCWAQTSLPLPQVFPSASEPLNLLSSASSFLLPPHSGPFVPGSSSSSSSRQQCTVNLPPLYHKSGSDACFNMDFLDNLSISDFNKTSKPSDEGWWPGGGGIFSHNSWLSLFFYLDFAQGPFVPQVSVVSLWFWSDETLHSLFSWSNFSRCIIVEQQWRPDGDGGGNAGVEGASSCCGVCKEPFSRNPRVQTGLFRMFHETRWGLVWQSQVLRSARFLLIYSAFPVLTGPDVLDYTFYQTLEHKCRKDILVGRKKHTITWKLIRPRPTKTLYAGPYYICKGNANTLERSYKNVSMVF